MIFLQKKLINKAYTGEVKQHNKIPIFIQYDKWIEYANSEIEDYTLYRIYSTTANIILNKRDNLSFGWFSTQLNHVDLKLISCKKQSCVVDCNYSTLVNNLWNTQITDEVELDKSTTNN